MIGWKHRLSIRIAEGLLGTEYNKNALRCVKVCYGMENILDEVEKLTALDRIK